MKKTQDKTTNQDSNNPERNDALPPRREDTAPDSRRTPAWVWYFPPMVPWGH
jgi:hypothetical protein